MPHPLSSHAPPPIAQSPCLIGQNVYHHAPPVTLEEIQAHAPSFQSSCPTPLSPLQLPPPLIWIITLYFNDECHHCFQGQVEGRDAGPTCTLRLSVTASASTLHKEVLQIIYSDSDSDSLTDKHFFINMETLCIYYFRRCNFVVC